MAKKITEDSIKKLIEEVLNEVDISITGPSIKDFRKDLDFSGYKGSGSSTKSKLKKLINIDPTPADTLDDDDFTKAVAKGASSPEYEIADWLAGVTTNTDISDAWTTATGGGGGGGTTLYFYADSSQTNLKPGFHAKNKPKKGKMGAIAKEMQNIIKTPGITNAELSAMLAEVTRIFSSDFGKGKLKDAVDDVNKALGSAPPAAAAPNTLKTKLMSIASALKSVETQDITAPVLQDVGSDKKQFPPGLITPLNGLFAEVGNDFDSRLKKLEEVTKLLVNGTTAQIKAAYPAGEERRFLRDVLITDYFATIFREVDDRSLGYYFESLGALLAGGAVQGASNASGDFTVSTAPGEDPFDGSSKAVQGASSQALSGFIVGRPVLYLVAKKPNTDVKKRTEIEVKAFTIQLNSLPDYDVGVNGVNDVVASLSTSPAGSTIGAGTGDITVTPEQISKQQKKKHGGATNIPGGAYTYRLNFTQNVKTVDYKLYFASKSGSTITNLKSMLRNKFPKTSSDDIAQAYREMDSYFDSLKKSQAAIKDYLGDDDVKKGEDALKTVTLADQSLEKVLTFTGKTVSGTGVSRIVKEDATITPNLLKKLIEESFKR